jgi:hypothetical protein
MRAFTNTEIIASRTKWAKRIAPLTMLFLVGGLIVNFISINQPQYFRFAVIMLIIGFFLSMASSYLVNHWIREPRSDQTLVASLKKFSNDFVLFNYTSAAPHLLLTPSRLYVIIARRQDGPINVSGSRFTRPFSWIRLLRFFADESLGAPVSEAQNRINKLSKLLNNHLEPGLVPEIKAFVLFTHKDVRLNLHEPDLPVLTTNQLKLYLRENDKHKTISADTRNKLIEILSSGHEEVEK